MKLLVAMVFSSLMTCALGQNDKLKEHRDFLMANFDTQYWMSFCTAEEWRIRCMFVDMDGDCQDELITCSYTEEDRMGDTWTIWKGPINGKMVRTVNAGEIVFNCHQESFYRLVFADGEKKLLDWTWTPKSPGVN